MGEPIVVKTCPAFGCEWFGTSPDALRAHLRSHNVADLTDRIVELEARLAVAIQKIERLRELTEFRPRPVDWASFGLDLTDEERAALLAEVEQRRDWHVGC